MLGNQKNLEKRLDHENDFPGIEQNFFLLPLMEHAAMLLIDMVQFGIFSQYGKNYGAPRKTTESR